MPTMLAERFIGSCRVFGDGPTVWEVRPRGLNWFRPAWVYRSEADARPLGKLARAKSRGHARRLCAPAPPPRARFGAPPAAARSQHTAGRTTDSSACLIRRSAVIFDCVGLRAVVTRPRVKGFASTTESQTRVGSSHMMLL
jgi:hypothetical protein